jgi:hypothetical protein
MSIQIDRPDRIDVARAEVEASAAEMGMSFDRLIDRMNLLGDKRASELALAAFTHVRQTFDRQQELATACMEVLQRLHDKELRALGSNPKDAAKALLAAAGYPTP